MIRTLIVEDDFRVAKVHAGFTERVEGFAVAGVVHTAAAALEAAARLRPDLVLLDVFLPDADGLEVQRRLAAGTRPPDVIFLTAMREMATVRAAMRAGALSYRSSRSPSTRCASGWSRRCGAPRLSAPCPRGTRRRPRS